MDNIKEILGFGDKNYITIFKGDTDFYTDWFQKSEAKYSTQWGWYFSSDTKLPDILPVGIEPIQLNWEDVSSEDQLKPIGKIKDTINLILYGKSQSEYVGAVGDIYEGNLLVKFTMPIESQFGISTLHIFEDDNLNQFTWLTNTKKLVVGNKYNLSGIIKDHKNYNGAHQTVLTRCKIEEI